MCIYFFLLDICCRIGSLEAKSEKEIRVQEMYQGVASESAPIRKGMDMEAGSGRSSEAVQSQQSFSQVHGQHCNWDGPSEFPLVGRGLDLCTVLCVCVCVCVSCLVTSNSLQPHRPQPTRPPSMGFSSQEHWSGSPFPSPKETIERK